MHFQSGIVDVPINPALWLELDRVGHENLTHNPAIDDRMRSLNLALYRSLFTKYESDRLCSRLSHSALDRSIYAKCS